MLQLRAVFARQIHRVDDPEVLPERYGTFGAVRSEWGELSSSDQDQAIPSGRRLVM